MKWIKKWKVDGSNGNVWTVAIDTEGNYGCSCPLWKFKRLECHHILRIKENGGREYKEKEKPKYILAKVKKPIYKKESNTLLIPLVRVGDIRMEATVCYNLLKYGYTMGEVRRLRDIPNSWTAKAIVEHIKQYGEAEYEEDKDGLH